MTLANSPLPTVSVIVPCMNDASNLPAMVESFLTQNYPFKEMVVHDGGSSDGSQDVLSRYPVRWTSAPDSGPHDALNRALLASTGEIIAVMNTNDRFEPGAISRAVQVLQQRPEAVLVHSDCRRIDLQGRPCGRFKSRPLDIDRLFWQMHIYMQSAFIKREVFDRVGLFDPSIVGPGDTEWLFRVVAAYPTNAFVYVPETWGCYRRSGYFDGASFADYEGNIRALHAAEERFLAEPENCKRLRHGPARARAGVQLLIAFQLMCVGRRHESWTSYRRALQLWPLLWLNGLGARCTAKLVLGKRLTETVLKLMLKLRSKGISARRATRDV
jgi:glycosyltransferase involved in cell wall biosynthesis